MEYNTARPALKLGEYGRNIQEMAQHLKTIENRDERNKAANSLINIMLLLNPQLKEQSEFRQKLWDHLYFLAGLDLDIDAPFPKPIPLEQQGPPQKPSYASNHIRFRHYGKNVENMIKKATEMEESPAKNAFLNALASYMKMAYRVWNDDKVPDEVIIEHVKLLSGGKIILQGIQEFAAHGENFQSRPKQKDNKHRNNNKNQKKNFRKG